MICKLQHADDHGVTVIRSIVVNDDYTWCVYVHGHALEHSKCSALTNIPATIRKKEALNKLVRLVDTLNFCTGNPDEHFLDLADFRKGKFQSVSNSTLAFTDTTYSVCIEGHVYSRTIRTTACEMLVQGLKCEACQTYRHTLRALHSQWKQQAELDVEKHASVSSHTNYRYLRTPQRTKRMSNLRTEVKTKRNEIERLKSKLKESTEKRGICVEKQLDNDLETIMHEQTNEINQQYAQDSFHRLFWDQQLASLKAKDKRQVRWHPMMIRWCLSLKLLSSASYSALRSSNLLVLPSERTLRDYTHFVKSKPGFSTGIDEQLCREANIDSIPEFQKYVCVAFDEVKIKEDLVYDKHSASLLGFVKIGDVNDHLQSFVQEKKDTAVTPKPNLATHVLTFMVSGILSGLEFPYASFPCSSITGDQLYSLAWGCVRRLEACGFKVIAFTCDGASANRKFFKLHSNSSNKGITYKTTNPFATEDRPIFFISDPPHLLKTVRNCWANSHGHSGTRNLWVSVIKQVIYINVDLHNR